ncbi:MAG TPA: hypothetical protein VFH34_16175, partial [Anaerolineales bacterium]|nr:hypothetical protein [Anaerolineales bacterium]
MKTRKQGSASWVGFFERGLFAPLLLSIQPVLHLFSINVAELSFSEILRPLLLSLLFGLMVLGVAFLFFRDWRRASLVASLFLVLFFLFGDAADWISESFVLGPARSNLLTLTLVTVVMMIWTWIVQKQIRDVASVNLYFNLLAILFFLNTGVRMGSYLLENGLSFASKQPAQAAVAEPTESRPDVYYIVLDGYGRQDILQTLYEFDNSSFLNDLSARGFYVA